MEDIQAFALAHKLTIEVRETPFVTDDRMRSKGFVDGSMYEIWLFRAGEDRPFACGGGRTRERAEVDALTVAKEKLGV